MTDNDAYARLAPPGRLPERLWQLNREGAARAQAEKLATKRAQAARRARRYREAKTAATILQTKAPS